jgi:hypothetical protein
LHKSGNDVIYQVFKGRNKKKGSWRGTSASFSSFRSQRDGDQRKRCRGRSGYGAGHVEGGYMNGYMISIVGIFMIFL